MSSPSNMRTGMGFTTSPESYLPETFFIIYLILGAILRRCGFKDCVLYAKHSKVDFTQEMFDTGLIFNLYSEYGVGKSLEPLLYELFSSATLDPEKNEHNIFFREIVRLTPETVNIVRLKKPSAETNWTLLYSIKMESAKDDIAKERLDRLSELLSDVISEDMTSEEEGYNNEYEYDISIDIEYDNNTSSDNSDNYESSDEMDNYESQGIPKKPVISIVSVDVTEEKLCDCSFCNEFRKYHNNFDTRDVTKMINDTLIEITKQINRTR